MTKAIRLAPLRWFDLGDLDQVDAARELCRGKAGVYLLRAKRSERMKYIGSSVPQEHGGDAKNAEMRLWKTIRRHFHACDTKPGYRFASDNFCSSDTFPGYELAIIVTPKSKAREVEDRAIIRYDPAYNAENQKAPKRRTIVPF